MPQNHITKPSWLRVEKGGSRCGTVGAILTGGGLSTVCEEALCPNRGECFRSGTATFMLLGSVCTRNCAFCNVKHGAPEAISLSEPARVAEAVSKLGLRHAVLTSVTRDDLSDGGAAHFAATIKAIRERCPKTTVEVLIPDFRGDKNALTTVVCAEPDVLNHNVETVPELYSQVRPQAVFERSIELLARVKAMGGVTTKSGFMVGLGETREQVSALLRRLRETRVDIVTIGQYLQPSREHYEVREYVTPEIFGQYRAEALSLGIKTCVSGPLVRSSYHAADAFTK